MSSISRMQSVLAAGLAADVFSSDALRNLAFPGFGNEHHTFAVAYHCIADLCNAFCYLIIEQHTSVLVFYNAWESEYVGGVLSYEFAYHVVLALQESNTSLFDADEDKLAADVWRRLRKGYQPATPMSTDPLVSTMSNILLPKGDA